MIGIPRPPALENLPSGTRLVAGMGASTVIADMDFETYSEAGHVWNELTQKWAALPGASQGKKGLPIVGAAVYAEHPSTEVLSFYYDLKEGRGRRHWTPGMPPPVDLFLYLRNGGVIEAWNVGFERWIWEKVCAPRFGWPALPPRQLRCAMAKGRAFALPGALDKAGAVLQLVNQKDADGKRLIDKFSKPRNPTVKDKRKRITPAEEPVDGPAFYSYNEQDIVAEAEASSRCPDLEGEELEFWLADQEINHRGVQIDVKGVQNCIAIVNQAHAQYNAELYTLTGGEVARASELAKLQAWFSKYGLHFASLDEEHIDEALARTDLPDWARRALEIRQAVGSAAVKKVFAMNLQATAAGRLHDLFSYHAARTGRATGNGPQPTNLPNSGPGVLRCSCGRHFGTHHKICPWCGVPQLPLKKTEEWSWRAVVDALLVIESQSLALVEHYFGDAMAAVSGCLRGLFVAADDHDLICSDYAAIEAVVLAEVSGEEWRREVFRTHGKIYEMSASKIAGIPFEDFAKYKAETGQHHPMRKKVGKVSELACFSPDTQVLTDRGYVGIVDVIITDKLWDGLQWVSHQGVIAKGRRKVISLDGVRMTPTHPIFINGSWREASQLALCASTLSRALANGSANLPSSQFLKATASESRAPAGQNRTPSLSAICEKVNRLVVTLAQRKNLFALRTLKSILPMPTQCRTMSTDAGTLTGWRLPSVDATTQKPADLKTTVDAAFVFSMAGGMTALRSCSTWSLLTGGTTRLLKWIGARLMGITNRATSSSSLDRKTHSISAACPKCNDESMLWSDVYDIAYAGPLSRFTIRTSRGHLIVHNSGYQGWIGAWKAFGADEFFTEQEMKDAILAWRAASPAIVEFWGGQRRKTHIGWVAEMYGVEGMFVSAVLNPGTTFTFRGFEFTMRGDAVYLKLLSGRYLTYHRPRLQPSDRGGLAISYEGYNTNPKNGAPGWVRLDTWGGRLTENIVQAVARDILRHAIVNLERAGYRVVLHVYDEIVAEVRKGSGSIEEFERILATMPAWAANWPIKAAGGWCGPRYRKD